MLVTQFTGEHDMNQEINIDDILRDSEIEDRSSLQHDLEALLDVPTYADLWDGETCGAWELN